MTELRISCAAREALSLSSFSVFLCVLRVSVVKFHNGAGGPEAGKEAAVQPRNLRPKG